MKNEIILRYCISNFDDITHDELTNLLEIKPNRVYIKGQKRNPNNPNSPLIKQNRWIMDSPIGKYSSFEDQMDSLLDTIEFKMDVFKYLSEKYDCEFSCGLYIYFDNEESTPSIHLGARYNKMVKELKVEFDIDLYVLPNEE